MRALAGFVVAAFAPVVALGLCVGSSTADAKSSADTKSSSAKHRPAQGHKLRATSKAGKPHKRKTRAARASAIRSREHVEGRELLLGATGQSVGAPWDGRLQHAAQLLPGDGYFIRRPWRSFGTITTVDIVERAIGETLDAYPDEHVLAIGDMSEQSGGQITQHRSHQSGRDVDIGLFYLEQPAGYPASFIHADDSNLNCAATFKLLESFLSSVGDDGGVQMVFLDFDVQGILYHWAQDNGVSERRLERIFQYPHGRGASEGLVRHEPNHDNHMHVRFSCSSLDGACQ